MRRAGIFVSLLLCALLCCAITRAQESRESWLRIEVTNVAGRALPRACVTIVPREGEIIFRHADRSGKVDLRRLAPGSYRVVVKADGYAAQKREIAFKSQGEVVTFALQPRKD